MRYFRKIVGERLYLSPFDTEDTDIHSKWAEWMNDRVVYDTFGGPSEHTTLTSAKKTVQELSGHRFFIVLMDGDALIGQISLHNIDHLNRHAFMGIMIGEAQHHGKGYGTEAVRMILNYGFNTLNLHSIMLSVHEDNYAGRACYKKVGFKESGRRREWLFKYGKYVDVLYMDMLSHEFEM